jgi:hypothetical protein
MRHAGILWAPLLVAGLFGAAPAHAQGACDPGDTLLGSATSQVGNQIVQKNFCAKTPGPWSRGELDHVVSVLNAMPDTPARKWVMANITLVRKHDAAKVPVGVIGPDGVTRFPPGPVLPPLPSPWAGMQDNQAELVFNDAFSSESPAVQRSLIAFESGKAFYLKLNLDQRFSRNLSAYAPAMGEMLAAGKAPGERNDDFADTSSQFGALFRVAMLQIPTAGHPGWQAPLKKLDDMLRRLTPP